MIETLFKFKWQLGLILAVFFAATFLFLFKGLSTFNKTSLKFDVSLYYSQTEVAIFIQAIQQGQLEKIKAHVNSGISPNVEGAGGIRPLFFAVDANQIEALKLLLDSGADPKAKLNDGMTLFEYAKIKQNQEIIQILKNAGTE